MKKNVTSQVVVTLKIKLTAVNHMLSAWNEVLQYKIFSMRST